MQKQASQNGRVNTMKHNLEWSNIAPNPDIIGIEVSTVCNLRCVMCPLSHAGGKVDRPAFLDDSLIDKLLPFMRNAKALRLFGLGEPLISPAFWRILQELRTGAHPERIEVSTNGQMLDENRIAALLDSPLTHITFSIDAARPETYRRLHGSDFYNLISIIKTLRSERDRRSKKMEICFHATVMRENVEQLPEIADLASEIKIDGLCFGNLVVCNDNDIMTGTETDKWQFRFSEQDLSRSPELRDKWIAAARARAQQHGLRITFSLDIPFPAWHKAHPDKTLPSSCYFPGVWLDVLSNGESRFCCYSSGTIGNIGDTSVEEVWNGHEAQNIRKMLSNNLIPEQCSGACCSFIHRRKTETRSKPAA